MVYGHGVNDMHYGWTRANERNYKIYRIWKNMLQRCYSENFHKKHPTYKGCSVCKRWLLLSNFVNDFSKIDGYNEEKFMKGELSLDKDIKSNGENKEYSLENCTLVSKSENTKQSNKTMDYTSVSVKICQYDKETNKLIKIWCGAREIERELNIDNGSIICCCKFWEINCNKEEWFKTHKNRPYKSAGGYIWKYYKET